MSKKLFGAELGGGGGGGGDGARRTDDDSRNQQQCDGDRFALLVVRCEEDVWAPGSELLQ